MTMPFVPSHHPFLWQHPVPHWFCNPKSPGGVMKTQTATQTETIPTTNSAPAERKPYEAPTLETHGIMTQIVGQSIGGPL
jgi:hypothetical protein